MNRFINPILKIISFIFLMSLSVDLVRAKEELFVCNYEVSLTSDSQIFFKATGYSDNTYELEYKEDENTYVDVDKYVAGNSEVYTYLFTSDKYVSRSYITLHFDLSSSVFENLYEKSSVTQCPIITTQLIDSDWYISLNESGSGYTYSTSGTYKELSDSNSTPADKPELNKSCEFRFSTKEISGLSNSFLNTSFKLYSNGDRYFCIAVKYSELDSNCVKWISGEDVSNFIKIADEQLTVTIDSDEMSNIFIQNNFSEINNNRFNCPKDVYFIYQSVVDKTAIVTTDKDLFDDYNKSTIGDAGSQGQNKEPTEDTFQIYEPICGIFKPEESGGKLLPIVKNLYRILKIAIPVLVVILTIVEFLKVLFSGEDKTMKDAFKATTTRLILIAVLIFLPIIIEFVIKITGLSENCLQQFIG